MDCWRRLAASLVFLAISSSFKLKVKVPWKLHADIHYAIQCPLPMIMDCDDMGFKHSKNGDLLMSVNCTVLRDIKELTEAEFMLMRCRDAVSFNTCEYYQTFRWKVGICEMLQSTVMPWPTLWSQWKPPITCPTRAGNYSLKDVKLSLADAALIDWAGYVWIGNATMRAERGALFTCKKFEMAVTRVRA